MIKQREKKKFKRQKIKVQNIKIGNVEEFSEKEIVEEKRAVSKTEDKARFSQKNVTKFKKGRVLEVNSNYKCIVKIAQKAKICTLSGRLKQIKFKTKNIVSVGDFVKISELNRIEEILPRKNALSRFSDKNFQKEVIISSNVDQVVITASVKHPEINFGLIDRYLCSAALENVFPIICLNKIDLLENIDTLKKEMQFYVDNEIMVIYVSAKEKIGLQKLKQKLKNRDTVFSGHSGAGKSSIINQIQPDLNLKVAEISEYSQKGTHTTSSTKMIEWDFGGYLVDTPGIKTFGLERGNITELPKLFPGFKKLAKNCKFNDCSHTHESNCAVKNAVNTNHFPMTKYESYLRILESLKE